MDFGEDLEEKTSSIGERPTVGICALIRVRREKPGHQMAPRGLNLNAIEAYLASAARSPAKPSGKPAKLGGRS